MELRKPARAMVHRAFGSVFNSEEVEDLYAEAWLGVLQTMERRGEELSEDEMRRYVMAAVANQAGRELRRRGRRPTASLEMALSMRDPADEPEEAAERREEASLAREVLATLPERRRAVMVLRYAWGLEPEEVCAVIGGLSPRSYRKEVTRGIGELADKMRMAESGEWCETREPLLHALAAGTASAEQRRQARRHLAHCRGCADHLANLTARLQEVAAAAPWVGVADVVGDGRLSVPERAVAVLDRGREALAGVLGRGPDGAEPLAGALATSGGTRGAGAAGAGVAAKLAGLGAVGKTVAACVGAGAAATACVAAGVLPIADLGAGGKAEGAARERNAGPGEGAGVPVELSPAAAIMPSVAEKVGPAVEPQPAPDPEPEEEPGGGEPQAPGEPATPLASPDPVSEELDPVGTPAPAPAAPSAAASGGGPAGGGSGGGGSGAGSAGGSGGDFGP